MDDVARAAGVSKSSVSRALNGVPGTVAPATAARVRRAMEELGYVPNAVAASLKYQRTKTVGLVLPDLGNPFFALVAAGVEAEISGAGYSLLVANTGNDHERETSATRMLLERQVDALLIGSSSLAGNHLRLALGRGVHVALVDSHPRRFSVDCITADNRGGAAEATAHLLALGHRDLGVIAGLADDSSAAERLQGVRATLDAAGLRLPHERCHAGDFGIASGREGAHALLGGPDPPTALFVANNLMTVGAMRGIADLGLRIPDDVSLVGFDDMDWYPLASPPITAVAQPAHEIGRRAARRLLERIRGTRRSRPRTELLPTELIVRASTAPPRRQRLRRQNPTRKEHP
ncbi:MAG TPA: LacI family DNA-binding transcriptional regulator [Gaiellaceae bacterium]